MAPPADHPLLIAGERVETGEWTEVRSPFSGELVGRIAKGGAAETRRALDAAAAVLANPLPAEEQNGLSLFSEVGHAIDYYFIAGANLDEVIGGYRFVTGKSVLLPRWAYGFWQSRQRYKTQDEMLGVVKEYRKRGIPLDNIVQDWFYWKEDSWGSHQFDPERYPDPQGLVEQLMAQIKAAKVHLD